MNSNDYAAFKDDYLKKFSPYVIDKWRSLEKIEAWSFDTEIEEIASVFNKLPHLFAYPIKKENREIIGELTLLLAYLPFVESMIALAWCGFNNEQWGIAIYEVSYDFYNEGLTNPQITGTPEYVAARTLVQRIDTVCKITSLQQVTGSQI
ncbi:hypothetical protein ABXZ88_003952 [Vibrio fluvialis]